MCVLNTVHSKLVGTVKLDVPIHYSLLYCCEWYTEGTAVCRTVVIQQAVVGGGLEVLCG